MRYLILIILFCFVSCEEKVVKPNNIPHEASSRAYKIYNQLGDDERKALEAIVIEKIIERQESEKSDYGLEPDTYDGR